MHVEKKDFISERDAWLLFTISAVAEAFSWMLLLIGILIQYLIPSNTTWVVLGGSIHGIIFLAYFVVVVLLWKVLKFTPVTILIALFVSIVPFGTLVFEQVMSAGRRREQLQTYRELVVRLIIPRENELLVIQSQDTNFYSLPGGTVAINESPQEAAQRFGLKQLGVTPVLGDVAYIFQYLHQGIGRIELFFIVKNVDDFQQKTYESTLKANYELEEICFVKRLPGANIRPVFLLENNLVNKRTGKVQTEIITQY